MTTQSSDTYVVTIWDKQANEPYNKMEYDDEETAKYVARRMKYHYIDQWGPSAEQYYEVRLHRMKEKTDA
jgi:hypothetical protein